VSACASGAEAIGYAIDMIRLGRADVVLAGGTEAAIIPLNIAAFAAMRALSTRNDEPERASRPFDKGRDGFVLGEGAGMVVLESEEHARQRGAQVIATKSMTGHLLGGAGAVEAVATILALRDRVAPPTINLDDPDEEARVDIATKPRELAPHGSAPMAALNNSFGFGGHNVTLAFTAA